MPNDLRIKSDLLTHHEVMKARNGGEVVIAGVPYRAAVTLAPVELTSADGGTTRGQKLRAEILKTVLLSPPARDSLVTFAGVSYSLNMIGGNEGRDVAWILEGLRSLK